MDGSLYFVLRAEKLGERERKALFPSQRKGHDDDDDDVDDENSGRGIK